MGLEEQLLTASITDTFAEAHKAVMKVSYIDFGNTPYNTEKGLRAEERRDAKMALGFLVDKAFRDVGILAERLGLRLLCREIARSRASIKDLSDVVAEEFHSEPLTEAHKFFASLESMTRGRAITGLGVFETVLQNTPKIIEAKGLVPKNEAEVRNEVRKVLEFCFRDVVREIPISKNLKVYKPDIGVTSLMAAAEYKFIDSKADAKKSLDELYADMKGYNGRYDWRSFYAVFYMTGPFYSQKDVDEEFRLVKAELSWTPILVVGEGRRKSGAPVSSRSANHP